MAFSISREVPGLLLTIMVLAGSCAPATAQTRWVREAANSGATSIALDAAGNACVVGYFSGATTLGQETLTSSAAATAFIAKYTSEGDVLWARAEAETTELRDVVVDNQGNIYATGSFTGSITAGGQWLTSQGSRDLLLVKYDPKGNVLWLCQGGSTGASSARGNGVAVDKEGNVYVTGTFSGTTLANGISITSASTPALLLSKYDSAGKLLWARQGSGQGLENFGAAVGVDAAGNAYVTGAISGAGFCGSLALPASGAQSQSDVLVAKCDARGNFLWARRDGGGPRISGRDIAVDQEGNAVVTGISDSGTAMFDAYAFPVTGGHDGFVVRYDAQGKLQWASHIAGSDTDYGTSIALDAASNTYVTGIFASLPTTWSTTTALTRREGKNAFAVKYDPRGKVLAAQREGACGGTFSEGIAVNSAGEIYIAGYFSGTVSFVSTLLKNRPGNLFVAKLGDLSTPSTPDSFSCDGVATIPAAPTAPTSPSAPASPTAPTVADVFVPNIITPNDDGLNDYLIVRSPDALVWSLAVYNRWGRQVYNSPAYRQNWNASGLSDGPYFYHLVHPSGLQVRGWVEVVR